MQIYYLSRQKFAKDYLFPKITIPTAHLVHISSGSDCHKCLNITNAERRTKSQRGLVPSKQPEPDFLLHSAFMW